MRYIFEAHFYAPDREKLAAELRALASRIERSDYDSRYRTDEKYYVYISGLKTGSATAEMVAED